MRPHPRDHSKSSGPEPQRDRSDLEERRRARHLQRVVDFSLAVIRQSPLSHAEAQRLAAAVRAYALRLFPGKEETYDLIYAPRFRRLLAEKYGLQ